MPVACSSKVHASPTTPSKPSPPICPPQSDPHATYERGHTMLRRRPVARRMVRTAAVVGTATVVAGSVNRHQQQKYADQDAAQAPPEQQYVEAAPAPAGPSPDAIEQLKELAGLRDQGILSEEEFAAQKAKILG